jgi:hypothetical protein
VIDECRSAVYRTSGAVAMVVTHHRLAVRLPALRFAGWWRRDGIGRFLLVTRSWSTLGLGDHAAAGEQHRRDQYEESGSAHGAYFRLPRAGRTAMSTPRTAMVTTGLPERAMRTFRLRRMAMILAMASLLRSDDVDGRGLRERSASGDQAV